MRFAIVQPRVQQRCRSRHGFTLLEALMATGILLSIVVAVTSAVTAGQQQAFEAKQRIAAALACEELMGRLLTETYEDLPTWNGSSEEAGQMHDMLGRPLPSPTFDGLGRRVTVTTALRSIADVGVRVMGRDVTVTAFDGRGRTLAEVTRFVPEPQA